jgi:hypothetical protein
MHLSPTNHTSQPNLTFVNTRSLQRLHRSRQNLQLTLTLGKSQGKTRSYDDKHCFLPNPSSKPKRFSLARAASSIFSSREILTKELPALTRALSRLSSSTVYGFPLKLKYPHSATHAKVHLGESTHTNPAAKPPKATTTQPTQLFHFSHTTPILNPKNKTKTPITNNRTPKTPNHKTNKNPAKPTTAFHTQPATLEVVVTKNHTQLLLSTESNILFKILLNPQQPSHQTNHL